MVGSALPPLVYRWGTRVGCVGLNCVHCDLSPLQAVLASPWVLGEGELSTVLYAGTPSCWCSSQAGG